LAVPHSDILVSADALVGVKVPVSWGGALNTIGSIKSLSTHALLSVPHSLEVWACTGVRGKVPGSGSWAGDAVRAESSLRTNALVSVPVGGGGKADTSVGAVVPRSWFWAWFALGAEGSVSASTSHVVPDKWNFTLAGTVEPFSGGWAGDTVGAEKSR